MTGINHEGGLQQELPDEGQRAQMARRIAITNGNGHEEFIPLE